jgi:DNA-binding PadR family transcriptional regulator
MGGRAGRGDVRIAILALLAERPMHGYEMIQELDSRTGGIGHPSPGSVYPTLQLLEEQGLIEGEQAEGKRLFSLTDAGRAEVAQQTSTTSPWEQITQGVDPAAVGLRDVGWGLLAAAKQVMQVGTPEQKSQAMEVLTETRRRLYAILAEDHPASS